MPPLLYERLPAGKECRLDQEPSFFQILPRSDDGKCRTGAFVLDDVSGEWFAEKWRPRQCQTLE